MNFVLGHGLNLHRVRFTARCRDGTMGRMQLWIRDGWVPIAQEAVTQLRALGVEVREAREKLGQLRLHVLPLTAARHPDVQAITNSFAASQGYEKWTGDTDVIALKTSESCPRYRSRWSAGAWRLSTGNCALA